MTLTYSTILFYGIHFYFITLFEVLFYIYYILPYEQSLLLRLFDFPSIGKLANSNYNITVVATELYETENCRDDTNRIFDANLPLYSYCFYYIGFIHFCLLFLFFYDINAENTHSTEKNLLIVHKPNIEKYQRCACPRLNMVFLMPEMAIKLLLILL